MFVPRGDVLVSVTAAAEAVAVGAVVVVAGSPQKPSDAAAVAASTV
jgi:hypothetical protein